MDSEKELPFVSAMIVYRNEESTIGRALRSILEQNYPDDRMEVILIDGMSTDNSRNVIQEVIESVNRPIPIKFINNEKKILSSGWNLGLKEAKGEYVFRIDGHSTIENQYIRKCLNGYRKADPKTVCVGGIFSTIAIEGSNEAISLVLSSPFGVGESKFRYSKESGYVETIACGLYKKRVFNEVGYFDEHLIRNQDLDLHVRIRKAGYKLYLDPSIRVMYFPRNTLKSMLKQAFLNGEWVMILFKKTPEALSVRHLVPFIFVLSLVVLAVLSIICRPLVWILLVELLLHLLLGFIFAVRKKTDATNTFHMPLYFMLLHIAYGIGSVVGLAKAMQKSKILK